MADITPRMSAKDYLLMMKVKPLGKSAMPSKAKQGARNALSLSLDEVPSHEPTASSMMNSQEEKPLRTNKYNAKKTRIGDEVFDSAKESRTFQTFMFSRQAQSPGERVVVLERSRRYLLVPKQEGERACSYVADFVVVFADGRTEVVDTKSDITRKNPLYVLKRKLMLERHNIRILEM